MPGESPPGSRPAAVRACGGGSIGTSAKLEKSSGAKLRNYGISLMIRQEDAMSAGLH